MDKQQEARVLSNGIGVVATGTREEMCGMANSGRQQFHDLTRLRIERNRAARHARCATKRTA